MIRDFRILRAGKIVSSTIFKNSVEAIAQAKLLSRRNPRALYEVVQVVAVIFDTSKLKEKQEKLLLEIKNSMKKALLSLRVGDDMVVLCREDLDYLFDVAKELHLEGSAIAIEESTRQNRFGRLMIRRVR